MELHQAIANRRSVRAYTQEAVSKDEITKLMEAACLAPSGKNGRPWRFFVVQDDKTLIRALSKYSLYDGFVRTADCLIFVFLDKLQSYHYIKDCQAIGACIQNMLLTACDEGLGACWIGEILNRDLFVKEKFGISHRYELMAMLAIGRPLERSAPKPVQKLDDCMLGWR